LLSAIICQELIICKEDLKGKWIENLIVFTAVLEDLLEERRKLEEALCDN
jgi:hypothetical protein